MATMFWKDRTSCGIDCGNHDKLTGTFSIAQRGAIINFLLSSGHVQCHDILPMGLNASRPDSLDDENVITVRKQIGRRSSLNILKKIDARSQSRSRLSTAPETSSASEESAIVVTSQDQPDCASIHSIPQDESDVTTIVHSKETDSVYDDSCSVTDKQSSHDDNDATPRSEPLDPISNRTQTPASLPMLPSPAVLDEESPTKYGLNRSFMVEQETTARQMKRWTTSGPELFKVRTHC